MILSQEWNRNLERQRERERVRVSESERETERESDFLPIVTGSDQKRRLIHLFWWQAALISPTLPSLPYPPSTFSITLPSLPSLTFSITLPSLPSSFYFLHHLFTYFFTFSLPNWCLFFSFSLLSVWELPQNEVRNDHKVGLHSFRLPPFQLYLFYWICFLVQEKKEEGKRRLSWQKNALSLSLGLLSLLLTKILVVNSPRIPTSLSLSLNLSPIPSSLPYFWYSQLWSEKWNEKTGQKMIQLESTKKSGSLGRRKEGEKVSGRGRDGKRKPGL